MTPMRRLVSIRGLSLLLLGALGCGLLSKDLGSFNFALPERSYHFDTSGWNLPPGNTAVVPCGTAPLAVANCCTPVPGVASLCSEDTSIVCETNVCTVKQTVTVTQPMDLKNDVGSLSKYQSLADVSLSSVTYDVTTTMNVPLPELQLYLADAGVTKLPDASAKLFGHVPVIPAGTPTGTMIHGNVVMEPNAAALFEARGHMLATPFTFLATTTVSVPSGSVVPMGAIDVKVNGTVTCALSL
jgi:hypothetical protein